MELQDGCFAALRGLAAYVLALIHPAPAKDSQALEASRPPDGGRSQDARTIMDDAWEDYLALKRKADALSLQKCSPSCSAVNPHDKFQGAEAIINKEWEEHISWNQEEHWPSISEPFVECQANLAFGCCQLKYSVCDKRGDQFAQRGNFGLLLLIEIMGTTQANAKLTKAQLGQKLLGEALCAAEQGAEAVQTPRAPRKGSLSEVSTGPPSPEIQEDNSSDSEESLTFFSESEEDFIFSESEDGCPEDVVALPSLKPPVCKEVSAASDVPVPKQQRLEDGVWDLCEHCDNAEARAFWAREYEGRTPWGAPSTPKMRRPLPEQRLDPEDGNFYTWDQMWNFCKGTYEEAEVKKYWDYECKPSRRPPAMPKEEERLDPEDGFYYTWNEMWNFCKGSYSKAEVKAYWDNECRPKMRPLQERQAFEETNREEGDDFVSQDASVVSQDEHIEALDKLDVQSEHATEVPMEIARGPKGRMAAPRTIGQCNRELGLQQVDLADLKVRTPTL
eukprot:Skav229613  [mRNA]  locus=scaffold510:308424:309935:- [translate_table: standard]